MGMPFQHSFSSLGITFGIQCVTASECCQLEMKLNQSFYVWKSLDSIGELSDQQWLTPDGCAK